MSSTGEGCAQLCCAAVAGPRQCGKTTLLRRTHLLLEDPDLIARVRAEPRSFLDKLTT
jgi:predicted AAA+ superfamily ATPase